MAAENKNQHYVPQYYLREFSNIKEQLYVYDLKTKKKFKQKIDGIAAKKFFYNVNLDLLNNFLEEPLQGNEQIIDKILNQKHEEFHKGFIKSFRPVKERILNKDRTEVLSVIDFHSLIDFILLLKLRNPKINLIIKEFSRFIPHLSEDECISLIRALLLLQALEKINYPTQYYVKDDIRTAFKPLMDDIEFLKNYLDNCKKIMFLNYTDVNFITSDQAIGMERDEETEELLFLSFPINKKVCIVFINNLTIQLSDFSSFKQNLENDESGINTVKLLNSLIARRANRHIFSFDNNFPENIESIEFNKFWNM